MISILLNACNSGTTSTSSLQTNYYSGASASYYQIVKSGSSNSLYLNIINASGYLLKNVPLNQASNGYIFNTILNGESATGQVVFGNENDLAFVINSNATAYNDFATTYANSNPILDGNYVANCDQQKISACLVQVINQEITITEYTSNGTPTILCRNQPLVNSHSINPYALSFNCTVNGGANSGIWYATPFSFNQTTAILIGEYIPSINANDNVTDDIAFPQQTIQATGNFNYTYYDLAGGSPGINTDSKLNSTTIVNPTTCINGPCQIQSNGFYHYSMLGFDYYTTNSSNYNLVGNDAMQIYADSYVGFYFK